MPRKTKKEKLLAREHRARQIVPKVVTPTHVAAVLPVEKPLSSTRVNTTETDHTIYFRQDLVRSLIVIAIIFFLEFSIYILNTHNFFTKIAHF